MSCARCLLRSSQRLRSRATTSEGCANNHLENQIRPCAHEKKAWLFCGSELAGQRSAIVMSLLKSAKLNGHNPVPTVGTCSSACARIRQAGSRPVAASLAAELKPTTLRKRALRSMVARPADRHGCATIKFDETPPSAGRGHLNRSPKAAFERALTVPRYDNGAPLLNVSTSRQCCISPSKTALPLSPLIRLRMSGSPCPDPEGYSRLLSGPRLP